MKRSDFLKLCLLWLAGLTGLRGVKPSGTTARMKEARFYRPADTLAG